MTLTEIRKLEAIVCSSILDEPTAKLGPNVCTALAYAPDMWASPEAAKVAEGIKQAIDKGRPTHRVVVGLLMDQEYKEWLKNPAFNDGLPLSVVETAVLPLIQTYSRMRVACLLGHAAAQIQNHPERFPAIARRLKEHLEAIL